MTATDQPREHTTSPGGTVLVTRPVNNDAEMEAVYEIRREVFVREQGLTRTVYDEPDDRTSIHLVCQTGGRIVGTGRLTFVRDEAHIAWVAVRKADRGIGAGKALMEHLLSIARTRPVEYATLNAQTHALDFYQSFGFESIGRRFHMSQIEHQFMIKVL